MQTKTHTSFIYSAAWLPHMAVAGELLAEISPWVVPFPKLIYFITLLQQVSATSRGKTNGRYKRLDEKTNKHTNTFLHEHVRMHRPP